MSLVQDAAKLQLAINSLKSSLGVARVWGRPVLATLLAAACTTRDGSMGNAEQSAADSLVNAARAVRMIPVLARAELRENSAAVMSATQAGVIFTINDSGHEAVLFALDTAGADRGAWMVRGATNHDWEAAALGPCDKSPGQRPPRPGPVTACIYIGDVGDNNASRPTRVLYRVREPRAGAPGSTDTVTAERLEFRYSDGPHDVEALWVGRDGTTWLATKRRLRGSDGRTRPALVFAIHASAWRERDSVVTAVLTDSLPVVPGSAPGRLITDAALSSDGRRLAVRTYTEVFVFATDSTSGRVLHGSPLASCDVTGLRERQGEGITWLGTAGLLLLTSEGNRSPMHVIDCRPGAAAELIGRAPFTGDRR
ncbi:MAG TPA: hypothetical protein VLE53_08310 [Gemmatimonadaceae bacterium]|nr:hypothetical protein [Gemmatimonadaceae bacterium]